MKKKIAISASGKKYIGALSAFALICVIIGVFCFQYYLRLRATIQAESGGYLQEVSQLIGGNINRTIRESYAVLETMVTVLESEHVESFSDVNSVVEAQREHWGYEDIMLIGENGVAYNASGGEVTLSDAAYLRKVVVDRAPSMSTSQLVNNREYILFAIPLDDISIGGTRMAALVSYYAPKTFSDLLSMSAFSGQAYSMIIGKDGTLMVRSNAAAASQTGYNVLSTIASSQLDPGSSMEVLRDDIANNRPGQIGYSLGDEHSYMIYTPVDPEEWYLLTFVPAQAVNARSDQMLNITLLLCGLITLIFAGLIAFLIFTFLHNSHRLEQIAYVDPVTGGNTIQKFYQLAQAALWEPGRDQYALVYTNIEKFKVLNEQLGRQVCDSILRQFNVTIEGMLSGRECMGRLSADNFCMLLRYTDEANLLERFRAYYTAAEADTRQTAEVWSLPAVQFGVFLVTDGEMAIPLMTDRAKLALREAPRFVNNKLYYAIYDDEVRRRLLREKQLEDAMEAALAQGQFQVYLQPKYRVSDERIGGAEALIRWLAPNEGMIYPDEFIPLFERNGFIVQVDLWVFEVVCRQIRTWLDAGRQPYKISVNCSRVHLRDPHFLRPYQEISARYQIPEGLLEIELTESIVMENAQQLVGVIDEIRAAGYSSSMDDFGSGYSSLNLIQELSVDTLKLDRIFFRPSVRGSERMRSVVSGIINMAGALKMETVAEGVEFREQVDILRELGCDLIQGYIFAKPMPIADFERLAFGEAE